MAPRGVLVGMQLAAIIPRRFSKPVSCWGPKEDIGAINTKFRSQHKADRLAGHRHFTKTLNALNIYFHELQDILRF